MYTLLNVTKELGYYNNLEINFFVRNDTAQRRTDYKSGRSDLMITTCDSLAIEELSGIKGTVVMATDISRGADGLLTKAEVRSVRQLKGKRIAYAEGTPSHFLLLEILTRNGITIDEFKPVVVDDPSKAATLLLAGRVDAAMTWEPYLSEVSAKENFRLLISSSKLKPLIIGAYLASDEILRKDPESVKEFISGWVKAIDFFKRNKEKAISIISKHLEIPESDLLPMFEVVKIVDLKHNKKLLKGSPSLMCEIVNSAWEYYSKYLIIKKQRGTPLITCTDVYLQVE